MQRRRFIASIVGLVAWCYAPFTRNPKQLVEAAKYVLTPIMETRTDIHAL